MNSGSYRLYILIKKDCHIKIGALGKCFFKKGIYVYSGSAMKNLDQRIKRHKRKDKAIRWHIDYLLAAPETEIIRTERFPSEQKEECRLNQELLKTDGAFVPAKGFGSSDCNNCPAHLVGLVNSHNKNIKKRL